MDISELVYKFRIQIVFLLFGLTSIAAAIILSRSSANQGPGIEIVNQDTQNSTAENLIVEISGSVNHPGVYKFSQNARIEDAIIAAGGLTISASQEYLDRILNRAAKLVDGQKIYIPSSDEQSEVLSARGFEGDNGGYADVQNGAQTTVNVNTATAETLESLWGIGPVTAQNVIDHRPYSSVEELLSKSILKKNVYERNKNLLSVF